MKIGIDIGGSHIAVGLIAQQGEILQKEEIDLVGKQENIEDILIQTIVKSINKMVQERHMKIEEIKKIGIASPGTVVKGEIVQAGNLGISHFKIVEELQKYFAVPIQLTNDAKCAALAVKQYGELKPYENAIFLTIGTGIGGAVFWNKELLRPKKYPGFEMGHMVIQKEKGKPCKCGKRGCFEQYASITALKNRVKEEYGLEEMTGKELYEFLEERMKEEEMKKIIEEYLENVAIGLGNLIDIFEPEAIGIGGSFAHYEAIFLPILQDKLSHILFNHEIPAILFTKIKNDAGMLGAV